MAKCGRKPGRPRTDTGLSEINASRLPKVETDEHRRMRAYFLSLPQKSRSHGVVAEHFGVTLDTVWRISRAFNWINDAKARDAAIIDPFIEQNRKEIDGARSEAFRYLCTALKLEIKRQALELTDEDLIEKLKTGDLDESVKDWKTKDWMNFVKNLSMKAKDYKDFINILDGIRKIVFEWDPNQTTLQHGEGNKTLEFNNCNLIIERGDPSGSPRIALPMTGMQSVKSEDKG